MFSYWPRPERKRDQPKTAILDGETQSSSAIDCAALDALLSRNAATVVDLASSRDYLAGHIPGAWFAIRTRLSRALAKIPLGETLVLTSEDGALARLGGGRSEGAGRIFRCASLPAATPHGARPVTPYRRQPHMADEAVDQWRKPYERSGDTKAAMNEYLAWEIDLLPRIARDGSLKFSSHLAVHS